MLESKKKDFTIFIREMYKGYDNTFIDLVVLLNDFRTCPKDAEEVLIGMFNEKHNNLSDDYKLILDEICTNKSYSIYNMECKLSDTICLENELMNRLILFAKQFERLDKDQLDYETRFKEKIKKFLDKYKEKGYLNNPIFLKNMLSSYNFFIKSDIDVYFEKLKYILPNYKIYIEFFKIIGSHGALSINDISHTKD